MRSRQIISGIKYRYFIRRFIIAGLLLFATHTTFSQPQVYLWDEVDPGWKFNAQAYWSTVKGYGRTVPEKMEGSISNYYDQAEKKFELALKENILNSSLAGNVTFTDNPGSNLLNDRDLFLDISCKILEVTDVYPNYRTRKLHIEPVIKYIYTLYDSRGDIVASKEILDKIDYKNNIRFKVRGMSEHRRDVEIIRLSFSESFSGPAIGRIISEISDLIDQHENKQIKAEPSRYMEIVGLVFENRKLHYPEKYKQISFEENPATLNIPGKEATVLRDYAGNDEISARLTELVMKSQYYALIISVNEYSDPGMNDLDEPMKDAQKLYNTLLTRYTFDRSNITFLANPDREQIIRSFDEMARKITENDNLLIFYAGHGLWDQQLKKGFWLPSNANADNRARWFSNSDLRDYIGGIRARHILLISDACFSGSIFKTREAFTGATPASLELYKLKSRKAMTSGAMTTVPDKSIFLEYLIIRLEENENHFLSSEQLFSSFKLAVINNSPTSQVPQFGEIRETGDEGGDFIFILKE